MITETTDTILDNTENGIDTTDFDSALNKATMRELDVKMRKFNQSDMSPDLIKQQADQSIIRNIAKEQVRDEAPFRMKIAAIENFNDNNMLSTFFDYVQGYKVASSSFEEDLNYQKMDIFQARDLTKDIIGFVDEKYARYFIEAKSQKHLDALVGEMQFVNNRRILADTVLSQTQQQIAGFTKSFFDIDTALSFGIIAAPRLATAIASRGRLALTSATVSGSKPFILNSVNDLEQDTDDLVMQSLLAASIEGLGVYFLTPELKAATAKRAAELTNKKAMQIGTDIVDNVMGKIEDEFFPKKNLNSLIDTTTFDDAVMEGATRRITKDISDAKLQEQVDIAVNKNIVRETLDFTNELKQYKGLLKEQDELKYTRLLEDEKNLKDEIFDAVNNNVGISKAASSALRETLYKEIDDVTELSNLGKKGYTTFEPRKIGLESTVKIKAKAIDGGKTLQIGNKLKIPIAIAAVLGIPVAAEASDFSDFSAGKTIEVAIMALVTAIALVAGYKFLKSDVLGGVLNRTFEKAPELRNQVGIFTKTQMVMRKMLDEDFLPLRTKASESFAPVYKKLVELKDETAINMWKKLLFNPVRGGTDVTEMVAQQEFLARLGEFNRVRDEAFKGWKTANKVTVQDSLKGIWKGSSPEYTFNSQISNYLEGNLDFIDDISMPYVKQAGDAMRKGLNEQAQQLVDLGVTGTEKFKYLKNYLPRKTTQLFNNLMNFGDDTIKQGLKQEFFNMAKAAVSKSLKDLNVARNTFDNLLGKELTEETLSGISASKAMQKIQGSVFDYGDISNQIDKVLASKTTKEFTTNVNDYKKMIDDLQVDEKFYNKISDYVDEITTPTGIRKLELSDIFNPLKNRVPLDTSAWSDMRVVFEGQERLITIDDIFIRDASQLYNRYTKGASAVMALKNAGYEVSDMRKIIKNVKDADTQQLMDESVHKLFGRRVYSLDSGSEKAANIISSASVAAMMVKAPISIITEFVMLGQRTLMGTTKQRALAKKMFGMLKRSGKDSMLYKQFVESFGFGAVGQKGTMSYRGQLYALDGFSANTLSSTLKEKVLNFGMTPISGLNEDWNFLMNVQKLKDFQLGLVDIPKTLMIKYGINDEALEAVSKYLKVDDDGLIQAVNAFDIPFKERNILRNVTTNMNQFGAQRTTIGGSPAWSYNNAFGAIVSQLLNYGINAIGNLAIPMAAGVMRGEREVIQAQMSYFFGGYLAAKARDIVFSREMKDESTYWKYAVLTHPIFGGADTLMSAVTNPPVLSWWEKNKKAMTDYTSNIATAVSGTSGDF